MKYLTFNAAGAIGEYGITSTAWEEGMEPVTEDFPHIMIGGEAENFDGNFGTQYVLAGKVARRRSLPAPTIASDDGRWQAIWRGLPEGAEVFVNFHRVFPVANGDYIIDCGEYVIDINCPPPFACMRGQMWQENGRWQVGSLYD